MESAVTLCCKTESFEFGNVLPAAWNQVYLRYAATGDKYGTEVTNFCSRGWKAALTAQLGGGLTSAPPKGPKPKCHGFPSISVAFLNVITVYRCSLISAMMHYRNVSFCVI